MADNSTAEQIADQLRAADAALKQLTKMSKGIDKLGTALTARVETSVAQLEMFDQSFAELRDALDAFVQLPNGVDSLSKRAEEALQQIGSARQDLGSAVEANRGIASVVTSDLQRSIDNSISRLAEAAAASAADLKALSTTSTTAIGDAAAALAGSTGIIAADIGSKVDEAISGSVELLDATLRGVQESAASALDPTIESARLLLENVASSVSQLSADLGEISGDGMAQLRRSVGESYGAVEGLLTFAQDKMKGIVDDYRASVLAVLHEQRQASDRASSAINGLTLLLDRSQEIQLLSSRLGEDVELLRRIELAVGSPKPSMAIRAELALTAAALSAIVAWLGTGMSFRDAVLVALPGPLILLWLEPLVTPLLSSLRSRGTG